MLRSFAITKAILLVAMSGAASASVMFDLRDQTTIEPIDEAPTITLTKGGIQATLSTPVGVLNGTASGFGVNHPTSGDPTDNIDGVHTVERVEIVFDKPVWFEQLVLSLYTPNPPGAIPADIAGLQLGSNAKINPVAQTSATDVYNFATDNYVAVGEKVVLNWEQGNGFSFNSFTVREVPEAGSLFVWAMGLAAVGIFWRRA